MESAVHAFFASLTVSLLVVVWIQVFARLGLIPFMFVATQEEIDKAEEDANEQD